MAQQTNIGFDLTQLDSIIKRLDKSLDNLLVKSNNAANNLSSQIKSLTKTDLKQLGDELVALRGKVLGAKKTKGIRSNLSVFGDDEASVRQYIALLEKAKRVEKTMRDAGVKRASQYGFGVALKEAKEYLSSIKKINAAQKETDATYRGSLSYAKGAKSVNDLRTAIRNLTTARDKENLNTARGRQHYEKLTAEIDRLKGKYNELTGVATKASSKLAVLGQKLGAYFSVYSIINFTKQLINVRKEFELQQISLEVLLQNKEKADLLWDKTIALAIKSPFRVKELVTYTKQLAAYRVETDKLYDTTRMLADISSGLGVDMNRLILAYGQVKAASFLRGTELRQFTEAGIPMLDELAKRFEALEGRAVGVDEVFARISKRMVSFKDVDAVLRSMTSEGGAFYRMQEIQAETLKGQMSNLRDSIDIMFNDIGKSMDNKLKAGVKSVRFLVNNWKDVYEIMKLVLLAYGLYRVRLLASNKALSLFATTQKVALKDANSLKIMSMMLSMQFGKLGKAATSAGKSIKKAFMNNWLIVALYLLANTINSVVKQFKNVGEAAKESIERTNEHTKAVNVLIGRLNRLNKAESQENDILNEKKNLLGDMLEKFNEGNTTIKLDIEELNQEQVDEWLGSIADALETSAQFERIFDTIISKARVGMEGVFHILGDNIETDAVELFNAYGQLSPKLIKNFRDNYLSVLMADFEAHPSDGVRLEYYNEILRLEKEFEEASKNKKVTMLDEIEYYNKLIKLAGDLAYSSNRSLIFSESIGDIYDDFSTKTRMMYSKYREVEYEIKKNINRLKKQYPVEDIENMSDLEKMQIYAKIRASYDPLQVDDTVKDLMARITAQQLNIPIYPTIVEGDGGDGLLKWQKEYNEFIKDMKTLASENETAGQQLAAKILKSNESRTDVANDVKKNLDEYKRLVSAYETGASGISKTEYENYKTYVKQLESAYKWLLGVDEKSGGSGSKDVMSDRIRAAKELYTAYKELTNQFDLMTSKEGAITKYGDAFLESMSGVKKDGKAITIDTFDMFSEEGIIAFFDWLAQYATEQKDKIKAELAKGEFTLEGKVEIKKANDQELIDSIQERFDQYGLTLELKKLNIPQNIGEDMFGITYTSLEDIRENILAEIDKIGNDGETELLKKLQEMLKKVEDESLKEQRERLKKYIDYARDSIGEMAKIKLEEMEKLAEIERTFKIEEGDNEATKGMKNDARKRAEEKAKKDAQDALNKYKWEQFEGSDTYLNIFNDLESTSTTMLNHMLKKLNDFKEQWGDMPVSDMKKVVDKIIELETALISKNPWKAYETSIDNVKKAMKDFNPTGTEAKGTMANVNTERVNQKDRTNYFIALEQEIAYQEEKAATIEEELANLETELRVTEGLKGNTDEEKKAIADKATAQRKVIDDKKKELTTTNQLITKYHKEAKEQDKIKTAYEEKAKAMGEINQMANDLNSSFAELVDALGGGELASIFMEMHSSMLNTVLSTIQLQLQLWAAKEGATALGAAMNTAMGIVGWIVMAIQLIVEGIKAVVAAQEKIRERQIESYLDKVEKLSEAYEKLADKADEAWDIRQLIAYRQELGTTYELMIRNQKAAIAVMETSKKVRQGLMGKYSGLESDEWKEYQDALKDLEELEEKAAETAESIVSKMTDGIFDSVVDAARDFTDAWADAFEETGSGLSGLEDNFKDVMLSMARQQATMLVTGRYTKQWQKMLEQFVNERDMVLTVEEAKEWARMVRATFENANEELRAYLEPIYDIFNDGGTYGLSGLEKGIQGITEETAQVLAAYFNAIRGYTANIDAKMDSVVASLDTPNSDNPVLNELRRHTAAIESIRSMLDDAMSTSTRGFNVKLIN